MAYKHATHALGWWLMIAATMFVVVLSGGLAVASDQSQSEKPLHEVLGRPIVYDHWGGN